MIDWLKRKAFPKKVTRMEYTPTLEDFELYHRFRQIEDRHRKSVIELNQCKARATEIYNNS